MFDFERIKLAKVYMDKLANGINPLDGTIINDDSVINNIHLSRCFFFVSDILENVLEKGCKKNKNTKLPFSVTDAQLKNFKYSDIAISISEVARRVNSLVDTEFMKKISYKTIRDWLISIKMLEIIVTSEGNNEVVPTPNGEAIGIYLESRLGRTGRYNIVLYNYIAQQFIIDNFDAVLDLNNCYSSNSNL